ncbi:MAG: hypothetical protein F6K39_46335, partial [Okeania sp. SIO3B3]|nr:hypothetical protein [Okeania sp. SIO3B3]
GGITELFRTEADFGAAFDIALAGYKAYVACGGGVQIIDVSDPAAPEVLETSISIDEVWAVDVRGDHLFTASSTEGVLIYELGNLGGGPFQYNDTAVFEDVAVAGDFAYLVSSDVFSNEMDLTVVDISEAVPQFRPLTGTYSTPGQAVKVAVQGDYAYVAGMSRGLQFFNVSDPENPYHLGRTYIDGATCDLVVQGPYVFTADGSDGFGIYDLSEVE